MHFPLLIQDLAVILGTATLVAVIFRTIRQPIVLGYLIAGIIVGPNTPPFTFVVDEPGIRIWSELGVMFLMFSLGLEFSFKKLRSVGKTAAFTGPFEALFMLATGYLAGRLLGFSYVDSLFLGAILSISSTTIIIKALEELALKKEKTSHLIFGILVVEDLVGILILAALPTVVGVEGNFSLTGLALEAGKLLLIVAAWIIIGLAILPRLSEAVSRHFGDEILTIYSLGLCLLLVTLSAHFHYSIALGAFVMGAILGDSAVASRIEELIRPIRDVFAAIFFVSIGMLLKPSDVWAHREIILLITGLTIIGKILSTAFGVWVTGGSRKTAIQAGMSLAQIGEFSFIIAALGLSLGVIGPALYPVAVSVSVLTTFTTPYLIRLALRITKKMA